MKKGTKKLLVLLLSMIMIFNIMPLANAFAAETEGHYIYTVENGEATITICNWNISGDIVIPSKLGGYPVTSIGDYSFHNSNSLTSISIPDSVTSIGYSAFFGCESLTSINVDENNANYSSQDGGLFNKDKTELIHYPMGNSRTTYAIPESVTSIDNWAFADCDSLTSVTIPDSVTSIGDSAFSWCKSLTNVTIPNSVTSIGDRMFWHCSSLTSVTISDSVTSIGDSAFYFCSSLTSVTIPDSVTSIGDDAFCGCRSLTSVTIPDSVTSIGDSAFYFCSSLTSVTIGNSVDSIGFWTFGICTSLTSVTIGNSVTSIGKEALAGFISLTSVTIPESVTSIDDSAFVDCFSLKNIVIKNPNVDLSKSGIGFVDIELTVSIEEFAEAYIEYAEKAFDGTLTEEDEEAFGNMFEELDELKPMDEVTIYGYANSTAQTYATENGFTFVEIQVPQQHEHSFAPSLTKAPTCIDNGTMTYTCSCGESYTKTIAATGNHTDTTGDGKCDTCGKDLGTKPSEDKSLGEKIVEFFRKIIYWFKNLFKR